MGIYLGKLWNLCIYDPFYTTLLYAATGSDRGCDCWLLRENNGYVHFVF